MTNEMTFNDFLEAMPDKKNRAQLQQVLDDIQKEFPNLDQRVAWNQPLFADHGTFIMGFSTAKTNFAVAAELVALEKFSEQVEQVGLTHTKQLIRVPWGTTTSSGPVLDLLFDIVRFNITDKKDVDTFWRK